MKKLTIRLEDYIHDRLNLVSKDNKTSINKTVGIILKEYIDNPKEINYLDEIDKKLKIIDEKINYILYLRSRVTVSFDNIYIEYCYCFLSVTNW